jgi:hypothetical protein
MRCLLLVWNAWNTWNAILKVFLIRGVFKGVVENSVPSVPMFQKGFPTFYF